MVQCSSHSTFEKMFENGMKHLSERLGDLTKVLTAQNEATKEILDRVVEGQAQRRELCGQRGAQIDALEKSDDAQWGAITDLRRLVWMGFGGLTVVNTLILLLAKWLMG